MKESRSFHPLREGSYKILLLGHVPRTGYSACVRGTGNNNSVESQKRRETRMHAPRVVASRGRYLAVCTRAYAYNHFPPTNLQTYHRTLYLSGAFYPREVGHYPSIREQLPASWGQTGRIFAFDPLSPLSPLHFLPILFSLKIEDISPSFENEKKIAGTWL